MRHKTLRLATLLALLGGTAMAVIALLLPPPAYVTGAAVRFDPLLLRSGHLLRRRAFNEVLERCDAVAGQGVDVTCPDINDPEAVRAFLRALDGEEAPEEEHAAAPLPGIDDLSDQQRALLRRMTRVGSCDEERMNAVLPGLYELCVTIVGPAGERGYMQRLLNTIEPSSAMPAEPSWTLEDYLRAFGGKVRPDR